MKSASSNTLIAHAFFAHGAGQTAPLRFCFAAPLRGTGCRHSITILTPTGLPPAAAPGLTFVWLCVRSALHQGIRPTGRPDRLWCPPRKAISPAVHSSSGAGFPPGKPQNLALSRPPRQRFTVHALVQEGLIAIFASIAARR